MSYHFSKIVEGSIEEAKQKTTEALKVEGFGVLTEINMQTTLKNRLDEDIKPYIILGACNPGFAFQALQTESHIGTMLPCNVILREVEEGKIEVSAVDPVASMQAIENEGLGIIAGEVRDMLQKVINSL